MKPQGCRSFCIPTSPWDTIPQQHDDTLVEVHQGRPFAVTGTIAPPQNSFLFFVTPDLKQPVFCHTHILAEVIITATKYGASSGLTRHSIKCVVFIISYDACNSFTRHIILFLYLSREKTSLILIFYLLAVPHCMWDLSSLTRDGTCTPCIGSKESSPWDCKRSPNRLGKVR